MYSLVFLHLRVYRSNSLSRPVALTANHASSFENVRQGYYVQNNIHVLYCTSLKVRRSREYALSDHVAVCKCSFGRECAVETCASRLNGCHLVTLPNMCTSPRVARVMLVQLKIELQAWNNVCVLEPCE